MPKLTYKPFKNAPLLDEATVRAGKMSIFDLQKAGYIVPLRRTNSKIDLVISQASDVQIDTAALCLVLPSLSRYSVQAYVYLLSLLKDNRRPIKLHQTELRNKSTDISKRQTFEKHFYLLLSSGLLWSYRSNEYYINPLYAWAGDRALYIDADRLPFSPSLQQDELL